MVKTLHSVQGARVQSLIRELRYHMPYGEAKKRRKKQGPKASRSSNSFIPRDRRNFSLLVSPHLWEAGCCLGHAVSNTNFPLFLSRRIIMVG